MLNPTRPNFTGKIQVKKNEIIGHSYTDKGEIALWKHDHDKYILRGYITIDGIKYLVSLSEAE